MDAGACERVRPAIGGGRSLWHDRRIRRRGAGAVQVDLGWLELIEGGYLLLKRVLSMAGAGACVTVTGAARDLETDLGAWCRTEGHRVEWREIASEGLCAVVHGGHAQADRWSGADRTVGQDPVGADAVAERPPKRWG